MDDAPNPQASSPLGGTLVEIREGVLFAPRTNRDQEPVGTVGLMITLPGASAAPLSMIVPESWDLLPSLLLMPKRTAAGPLIVVPWIDCELVNHLIVSRFRVAAITGYLYV